MDNSILTPEMAKDVANFIETFESKNQYPGNIQVGGIKSTISYVNDTERLTLKDIELLFIPAMHTHCDELIQFKTLQGVKRKTKEIVAWKQLFSYVAYKYGYSKIGIGRFLIQNHATVIHSIKTIENYIEINDSQFNSMFNHFKKYIKEYVGTTTGNVNRQTNAKSAVASLCS